MSKILFSDGDIIKQTDEQRGKYMIVEAGSQRFALEIVDAGKAWTFNKTNNIRQIYDDAHRNTRGTHQDKVKAAVMAVVNMKDSGLKFYESTDKRKLIFKETRKLKRQPVEKK